MTILNLAKGQNDFFTTQLMNQLFQETREDFKRVASNGQFQPRINVLENESEFLIQIAVPGFAKEDVNIQVEKDMLRVWAEFEKSEDEVKYLRREFGKDNFNRTFRLSKMINQEEIGAVVENGVLSITLPKVKEEARIKKIEIR